MDSRAKFPEISSPGDPEDHRAAIINGSSTEWVCVKHNVLGSNGTKRERQKKKSTYKGI